VWSLARHRLAGGQPVTSRLKLEGRCAVKKTTNPIAKSLSEKLYKPRIVKPKKGRGSYKRQDERKENAVHERIPHHNDE
jgi:stalled ribosome alternative rescue factor ArfA